MQRLTLPTETVIRKVMRKELPLLLLLTGPWPEPGTPS